MQLDQPEVKPYLIVDQIIFEMDYATGRWRKLRRRIRMVDRDAATNAQTLNGIGAVRNSSSNPRSSAEGVSAAPTNAARFLTVVNNQPVFTTTSEMTVPTVTSATIATPASTTQARTVPQRRTVAPAGQLSVFHAEDRRTTRLASVDRPPAVSRALVRAVEVPSSQVMWSPRRQVPASRHLASAAILFPLNRDAGHAQRVRSRMHAALGTTNDEPGNHLSHPLRAASTATTLEEYIRERNGEGMDGTCLGNENSALNGNISASTMERCGR